MLFKCVAADNGMHIVSHVMPLINAIKHHAFEHGNHIGSYFVQHTDYRKFIACSMWIGHKLKKRIGKSDFIDMQAEKLRHLLPFLTMGEEMKDFLVGELIISIIRGISG